jgi:hypothetical protein
MARCPLNHDWTIELGTGFSRHAEHGDVVFHGGTCSVYASVYQAPSAEAENAIAIMLQERETTPSEVFDRKDPPYSGRAYLIPEGEGNETYWGLNTWTADGKSLACVTFYFSDLDDLDWALKAWQSLSHGQVKAAYAN